MGPRISWNEIDRLYRVGLGEVGAELFWTTIACSTTPTATAIKKNEGLACRS